MDPVVSLEVGGVLLYLLVLSVLLLLAATHDSRSPTHLAERLRDIFTPLSRVSTILVL